MVKNPSSNAGEVGSILGWRARIIHVLRQFHFAHPNEDLDKLKTKNKKQLSCSRAEGHQWGWISCKDRGWVNFGERRILKYLRSYRYGLTL